MELHALQDPVELIPWKHAEHQDPGEDPQNKIMVLKVV